MAAARSLAETFHANNIKLIFGGGTKGIMGEVARSLVALSGPSSVEGIIPAALLSYERTNGAPETPSAKKTRETIDESTYGHTTVVRDMHTRKALMAEHVKRGAKGSGFVTLSGGYGTLEELMEMTTWNQLGIHGLPVVVFNVEGYWDGLLAWVKGAVESGFVGEGNRGIIVEAGSAGEVVERLRGYRVAEGRFVLEWEGR